jgi:hypothetical protein
VRQFRQAGLALAFSTCPSTGQSLACSRCRSIGGTVVDGRPFGQSWHVSDRGTNQSGLTNAGRFTVRIRPQWARRFQFASVHGIRFANGADPGRVAEWKHRAAAVGDPTRGLVVSAGREA